MIIYPERDIIEPIQGQHEALISIGTLHKIIEKLQDNHKTDRTKLKTTKMSDEHPLRGVITCPCCERKFSSWSTTKWIGK